MEASFIAATKLPKPVVEKQLNERTDITNGHIGAPQRDSILQAGIALQKAGVIPANVDVAKAVSDLIDDSYV
jgi:sulfonate transport system substrate-binding protein